MPLNLFHPSRSSRLFSGINCTDDRIVCSNDGVGFRSNFPFDQDIELGTLIIWVGWLKGAFMGNNVSELPQFGSIVILLLNVIEDLTLKQTFFVLVIIDGAAELELFSITMELGILLFNGLNNVECKIFDHPLGDQEGRCSQQGLRGGI